MRSHHVFSMKSFKIRGGVKGILHVILVVSQHAKGACSHSEQKSRAPCVAARGAARDHCRLPRMSPDFARSAFELEIPPRRNTPPYNSISGGRHPKQPALKYRPPPYNSISGGLVASRLPSAAGSHRRGITNFAYVYGVCCKKMKLLVPKVYVSLDPHIFGCP